MPCGGNSKAPPELIYHMPCASELWLMGGGEHRASLFAFSEQKKPYIKRASETPLKSGTGWSSFPISKQTLTLHSGGVKAKFTDSGEFNRGRGDIHNSIVSDLKKSKW